MISKEEQEQMTSISEKVLVGIAKGLDADVFTKYVGQNINDALNNAIEGSLESHFLKHIDAVKKLNGITDETIRNTDFECKRSYANAGKTANAMQYVDDFLSDKNLTATSEYLFVCAINGLANPFNNIAGLSETDYVLIQAVVMGHALPEVLPNGKPRDQWMQENEDFVFACKAMQKDLKMMPNLEQFRTLIEVQNKQINIRDSKHQQQALYNALTIEQPRSRENQMQQYLDQIFKLSNKSNCEAADQLYTTVLGKVAEYSPITKSDGKDGMTVQLGFGRDQETQERYEKARKAAESIRQKLLGGMKSAHNEESWAEQVEYFRDARFALGIDDDEMAKEMNRFGFQVDKEIHSENYAQAQRSLIMKRAEAAYKEKTGTSEDTPVGKAKLRLVQRLLYQDADKANPQQLNTGLINEFGDQKRIHRFVEALEKLAIEDLPGHVFQCLNANDPNFNEDARYMMLRLQTIDREALQSEKFKELLTEFGDIPFGLGMGKTAQGERITLADEAILFMQTVTKERGTAFFESVVQKRKDQKAADKSAKDPNQLGRVLDGDKVKNEFGVEVPGVGEFQEYHKPITKTPYRAIVKNMAMAKELARLMFSSFQRMGAARAYYKHESLADYQDRTAGTNKAAQANDLEWFFFGGTHEAGDIEPGLDIQQGKGAEQFNKLCKALGLKNADHEALRTMIKRDPEKVEQSLLLAGLSIHDFKSWARVNGLQTKNDASKEQAEEYNDALAQAEANAARSTNQNLRQLAKALKEARANGQKEEVARLEDELMEASYDSQHPVTEAREQKAIADKRQNLKDRIEIRKAFIASEITRLEKGSGNPQIQGAVAEDVTFLSIMLQAYKDYDLERVEDCDLDTVNSNLAQNVGTIFCEEIMSPKITAKFQAGTPFSDMEKWFIQELGNSKAIALGSKPPAYTGGPDLNQQTGQPQPLGARTGELRTEEEAQLLKTACTSGKTSELQEFISQSMADGQPVGEAVVHNFRDAFNSADPTKTREFARILTEQQKAVAMSVGVGMQQNPNIRSR